MLLEERQDAVMAEVSCRHSDRTVRRLEINVQWAIR
jgi:hypothetical protein